MAVTLPISLDDEKRLVLSRSAAENLARGRLKLGSSVRVKDRPDGGILPERIALDGTWKLNEAHDLEFLVSASSVWFPGMTILFKTGVTKATGDRIVFSARLTDYGSFVMSSVLTFSGRWQADKNNRLNFTVTRYAGKTDRLVFQGAWEIGKNNELFYKYSARSLKTREKKEFSFGLKGKWDLGPRKIAYKIEGSGDSVISFSAALETPGIRAKDGQIRYSVGVRFTSDGREREVIQKAAIFGTWKLGRDLSLGFEAQTTAKGKNVLTFTAEKPVLKGGNLFVGLKCSDGKKLGAEVKFAKPIGKDMEMFVGGAMSPREYRVIGGVRGRF
jgi:hypothetical protein